MGGVHYCLHCVPHDDGGDRESLGLWRIHFKHFQNAGSPPSRSATFCDSWTVCSLLFSEDRIRPGL